jgi:glycosyltransferase involved in cell wall biosynthesis
MSHKKDLFLILYSDLVVYAGGIESWLIKFLANRKWLYDIFDNFYIICLNSAVSIEEKILNLFKDADIHFILISLKSHIPFIKGIEYHIKGLLKIKEIMKCPSVVIGIGTSFHELFLVASLKKRKTGIIKGYWIRNILLYLLKTRKTGILTPVIYKLERPLLNGMDFVIANGEDTFNYYKQTYNLNNLFVNPNAIDESQICPNKKPFQNNTVKIGYIGRLVPEKGFDIFLKSIEEIGCFNVIEFYIIGYGEMEYDARKISEKYKNVIFIGRVSNQEVYSYLSILDATVHLTKTGGGGLSNSLLESIFSNNLIICWDNPIFTQIMSIDTSVLVKEENISQLTSEYRKISINRDYAIEKIKKAESIKKEYTIIDHMVKFRNIVENF